MPGYLKRTGRDITDDILIRLREAERELAQLRRSPRRTTIDRGDIPAVADPFEGQQMIQYADNSPYVAEQPYYYSNGQWRAFNLAPVTGIELLQSSGTLTITSGGTDNYVGFAHHAGDSLMDFSSIGATAPVFIDDGIYAASVSVVVGQKVSAGKSVRGEINTVLAHFSGLGPGDTSQYIGDGTIGSPLPFLSCAVVVKALAGDSLLFVCGNDDTITHTYNAVTGSAVVRLS